MQTILREEVAKLVNGEWTWKIDKAGIFGPPKKRRVSRLSYSGYTHQPPTSTPNYNIAKGSYVKSPEMDC